MLQLIIRYTSILLCSDYLFLKLLNKPKASNNHKIILFIFSLIFSSLSFFAPKNIQYINYVLLFLFHFIYYGIITSLYSSTLFLALLISYGICYCLFFTSIFLSAFTFGLLGWYFLNQIAISKVLLQFFVALVLFVLSTLPFKIPRLKKGMPFLYNREVSNAGSTIALFILLLTMLVSSQTFMISISSKKQVLFYLFILLLFLLLFVWWRDQIRQTYLNQLKEREIKRLEEELQDYQITITSIEQENKNLSKLVHRDNKQLASLQLAVETLLSSQVENKCIQEEIGNTLLQEIRTEMDNRKQLVSNLSTPYVLPSTKVPSVDHLLLYMLHRGQADGIHLELSLTGNVHYLLEEIIRERDFLTLLADILENALIATKCASGTAVLLHIGIIDETYSIDAWDSGIPFTKETLLHLGRKRYTTHKKTGGSGIGLMSTFELLEKYQASLYIDEKLAKENIYTKKVSIVFDRKREYHLHTNRSTDEQFFLRQRADLHIDTLAET